MVTSFRPLDIRKRLGKDQWGVPYEFGPDGWIIETLPGLEPLRIILSCGPAGPNESDEWFHASIACPHRDPTYLELAAMHKAVWPDGHSYQVFVPPSEHVNIHEHALHLWGRPDGRALLPNFGWMGQI